MDDLPRLQLRQIDTLESCTHEVALPPDMQYTPLKPSTGPPAKEYPFILDPFQKESILCLENNESVSLYIVLEKLYLVLFGFCSIQSHLRNSDHEKSLLQNINQ